MRLGEAGSRRVGHSRSTPLATLAIGYMPVLTALGDGSAMTQKDLALQAIVEQPTMAATLSRMERDGWIRRLPDSDDMRSALVSLTAAALEKMDDLREVIASVNRIATKALTPTEQAQYLELLQKIIAALQEADASGPTP